MQEGRRVEREVRYGVEVQVGVVDGWDRQVDSDVCCSEVSVEVSVE
jgi:hypothetical protein